MPAYHFGVPQVYSYDPSSATRESLSTSSSAESRENTPASSNTMSGATEEPRKDVRNVRYHLEKTAQLLEELAEQADELTERADELREKADELSHHAMTQSGNGCDDVCARIGGLTLKRRDDLL